MNPEAARKYVEAVFEARGQRLGFQIVSHGSSVWVPMVGAAEPRPLAFCSQSLLEVPAQVWPQQRKTLVRTVAARLDLSRQAVRLLTLPGVVALALMLRGELTQQVAALNGVEEKQRIQSLLEQNLFLLVLATAVIPAAWVRWLDAEEAETDRRQAEADLRDAAGVHPCAFRSTLDALLDAVRQPGEHEAVLASFLASAGSDEIAILEELHLARQDRSRRPELSRRLARQPLSSFSPLTKAVVGAAVSALSGPGFKAVAGEFEGIGITPGALAGAGPALHRLPAQVLWRNRELRHHRLNPEATGWAASVARPPARGQATRVLSVPVLWTGQRAVTRTSLTRLDRAGSLRASARSGRKELRERSFLACEYQHPLPQAPRSPATSVGAQPSSPCVIAADTSGSTELPWQGRPIADHIATAGLACIRYLELLSAAGHPTPQLVTANFSDVTIVSGADEADSAVQRELNLCGVQSGGSELHAQRLIDAVGKPFHLVLITDGVLHDPKNAVTALGHPSVLSVVVVEFHAGTAGTMNPQLTDFSQDLVRRHRAASAFLVTEGAGLAVALLRVVKNLYALPELEPTPEGPGSRLAILS